MRYFVKIFKASFWISCCVIIHPVYGQNSNKLISQIDYKIESGIVPERENGTIKYSYDDKSRITSLTLFDKINLNNIKKYDFKYFQDKIVVSNNGYTQEQGISLDKVGRIIEGGYLFNTKRQTLTFPLHYKFSYNPIGLLKRVNGYSHGETRELLAVYDFIYSGNDLAQIRTTFRPDHQYARNVNLDFQYYDKSASSNVNYLLGFLAASQTDKYFIYSITGNYFGISPQKLLKTITYYGNGYSKDYEIKYEFNPDDTVSKIIISTGDYVSTYLIRYK
jgi:hypothetical protein